MIGENKFMNNIHDVRNGIYVNDLPSTTRKPINQTIIVQQIVQRKETSSASTIILVAGILFWAHGSATHDSWFEGEEVAGQAITGLFIGLLGILCCCCCTLSYAAANARSSEIEESSININMSTHRRLMSGLFKKGDGCKSIPEADIENNVNYLN